MFGLELGFNRPWYLLLLALLPVLWVLSYRSLAGLGKVRRLVAILLRTSVLMMFILALAEIQLLKTSEKMTVIYLLDQSESVPLPQRQVMMKYVVSAFEEHRNSSRGDKVGVIIFGADAKIEIPPFTEISSVGNIESAFDMRTDATNLSSAIKLAQALFPKDSAKRIVIVSDGNENLGDAKAVARMLADDGIGVDVVPVQLNRRSEVAVEKVTLPTDIRLGQPMETRVVINNYTQPTAENPAGVVRGIRRITRNSGPHEELLSEQEVELKPGKNVFTFQDTISQPAVYTYKADFTPLDARDDALQQNNRATAFTHVRGKGRVLMIEDWQNKGEFDFLVNRLRESKIEVDLVATDNLFTSPQELMAYDSVILANVPRSSGDENNADANAIKSFSDEQIELLVRNTEQMGSGLIMLGGPQSYGAGGWANTKLEEAMPVDFQIKNSKVQAVGALVLMMHASELADGNHWQKVTAREAIKALGPMDYCGLIHWSDLGGSDDWLWGKPNGLIRVGGQQKSMIAKLDRMVPGDMPQFDPAMKMSLTAFNRVNASVKHMIIISDGDPVPPNNATVAAYKAANIQISTVAIGTHGPAGSTPLQGLATATGGKYYVVTNPKALPRIYQREARRVSRPLIYEPDGGVSPQVVFDHEALAGVDKQLPPIKGFMLTTVKDNPLVEVSIRSPKPDDAANSTILASWTYGLGRTAVLTTDAGKRWASSWTEWPNYDKLFSQLVRWSMRPSGDEGKFTVATDIKDGKVRVVVTALDKDDEFLNFLNISGTALDPNLKGTDIKITQTAPGRYVGEFTADQAGSYFVTVVPGAGKTPILAGVNVPYSSEFRERETNRELLTTLASFRPKGGEAGVVIDGALTLEGIPKLLKTNNFRDDLAKAISSQDVWPLFMLIAAGVFFIDVLVRRVTLSWEWTRPVWGWIRTKILRREAAPVIDERMARLKSRKAAVGQSIDERRAATRFEPQVDTGAPPSNVDDILREATSGGFSTPTQRPTPAQGPAPGAAEGEDYTARLLKAKQKAFKDKK